MQEQHFGGNYGTKRMSRWQIKQLQESLKKNYKRAEQIRQQAEKEKKAEAEKAEKLLRQALK